MDLYKKSRLATLIMTLAVGLSLFISILYYGNYSSNVLLFAENNYEIILQFVLLYFFAHSLRVVRLYVLLIDSKVGLGELLKEYFLTTWVNLVIPFKMGELFRVYRFGKMTGKVERGVSVVWVERIFDSTILLVFYIIIFTFNDFMKYISLVLILFSFVFFSFIFYMEFSSSYKYINNLIMSKSKTRKGLFFLKQLEKIQSLHKEIKLLLQGRVSILLFSSLGIWMLELVGISIISRVLVNGNSVLEEFLIILNETLLFNMDQNSVVQQIYMIFGMGLLLVLIPISYLIYYGLNKKKNVGVSERA